MVTGEFGGNTFAVVQLPATASAAVPTVVDYAVTAVPSSSAAALAACGESFYLHTIAAYTSPNTGHSIAVFAGYNANVPSCLAVVDMTTVINSTLSPRGGGAFDAHEVSPTNLPASAVTFIKL